MPSRETIFCHQQIQAPSLRVPLSASAQTRSNIRTTISFLCSPPALVPTMSFPAVFKRPDLRPFQSWLIRLHSKQSLLCARNYKQRQKIDVPGLCSLGTCSMMLFQAHTRQAVSTNHWPLRIDSHTSSHIEQAFRPGSDAIHTRFTSSDDRTVAGASADPGAIARIPAC
jgi:hypothetical protein